MNNQVLLTTFFTTRLTPLSGFGLMTLPGIGLISLLTAGLMLAGPVAAQSADTTLRLKNRSEAFQAFDQTVSQPDGQTVAQGVAPHTPNHRYRSRVARPVAIPEKGTLFSTGQVGNYSAVPLPEDFRYEDTRPWRRFDEIPQRHAEPQRRVRTPAQNERRVRPMKDNVRKVRRLD